MAQEYQYTAPPARRALVHAEYMMGSACAVCGEPMGTGGWGLDSKLRPVHEACLPKLRGMAV